MEICDFVQQTTTLRNKKIQKKPHCALITTKKHDLRN